MIHPASDCFKEKYPDTLHINEHRLIVQALDDLYQAGYRQPDGGQVGIGMNSDLLRFQQIIVRHHLDHTPQIVSSIDFGPNGDTANMDGG